MSGVPPRPAAITLLSNYEEIHAFLAQYAGPEAGRRIADAVGNGAGFQWFSDQQLLDLGIPPAILSRLRAKIPFQPMPPTSPVPLSTTPLQSSPQSQTSGQGGHTPQRSPPPPSTPVVNGGSGNSSGGPQSSPTFRSVPYTDADVRAWSNEQIKHWAVNVCGTSEVDAVKLSEMSGADVLNATLTTLRSLTADAKAKVLPCVKAKTWGERREVVQPTVTDTSDGVSVAVLSRADVCERLLPSNRTPTNFELNTLLAMCKSAHNANTNSTREKPTSSALSTIPTAIATTDVLLGPYRAFCEATRRGYHDTAMYGGEGVKFQLPPKVQEKETVSDVLAELTRDEHFTVIDYLGLTKEVNGEARLEGATSVVLRCVAIGAWAEALEDSNVKLDFALKLIRNNHGDGSRTTAITRNFAHEYSFPKAMLGNRSIVKVLANYVALAAEFQELIEYHRKETFGTEALRTRTMAIAMPLMKFTLKRYVKQAHKLNAGRPGYIFGLTLSGWLRLFLGMLDALVAMWQYGIVHRDLKPGNVMIDDQGRAIVIDFGGATCILDPDTTTPFSFGSPESAIIGNQTYSDPWVRACHNVDFLPGSEKPATLEGVYCRYDLYAVGLMMIQFLAGLKKLAPGSDPTSIPLHPDCPPALVGLLRMICQPLPTHRPTAHQAFRLVACIAYDPKPADVTNVAQAGDWLTKERLRTMLEGKAPHEHPLDFEYKTLYLAISTPESLLEDVTYIKTRSATK